MPNNDLISRATAIDALTDTNLKRNVDSVCDGDMNRTRRAAQRVIAQLPAVDAVPVVRCMDCKYSAHPDGMPDGLVKCVVHGWGGCISGDFYCGDAARRGENTTEAIDDADGT